MSQLLPYEQIITEKIGHVPIPGMADEVWASIDILLGPDALSTSNGAPETLSSTAKSGINWLGVCLSIVTVIIIFTVVKKAGNKNNQKNNSPFVPPIETNKKPDSGITGDSASPTIIYPNKNKENKENNPGLSIRSDSTFQTALPPILLPTSDSSDVRLPDVIPQTKDSLTKPIEPPVTQGKKGKGVKGIKDSDYKIVPAKKDSL